MGRNIVRFSDPNSDPSDMEAMMFWTFVAVALTVVAFLYSKAYEETGATFYLVFKWFYLVMALSAAVYAGGLILWG